MKAAPRGRGRRIVLWVAVAALAGLVGVVAFIGVRAWLASTELAAAEPLVGQIRQSIGEGDPDAAAAAARLAEHTESAAVLTSDPVWRAAEGVPWLGANLAAVRTIATELERVADDAIVPLAGLAGTMDGTSFAVVDGRIDVAALAEAEPDVGVAARALSTASERVDAIDASGLVAPVATATFRLQLMLAEASDLTDAIDRAVRLLPSMLGADGERRYLVLFQNNAELRTAGGIPGALALVGAQEGALELIDQIGSGDIRRSSAPVLPLPDADVALYGRQLGQYIQDVTATPDFELSGRLAAEMWLQQRGDRVDGVVAVDPVGLSYLLAATGPVTLANGDTLSAETAERVLLVDTYARYPDDAEQDDYFASVASAVFEALAAGTADPAKLINAVVRMGQEHRISIWSANGDEQAELAGTTLAGMQATQDALGDQAYAVYLNDRTGGKMGPYLDVDVDATTTARRADGRAEVAVTVTLTSTAPIDAATSLPVRTTNAGRLGVPAGVIATNVTVYSPNGAFDAGVSRDGSAVAVQTVEAGERLAKNLAVDLAPGESATVVFQFVAADARHSDPVVFTTPLVTAGSAVTG